MSDVQRGDSMYDGQGLELGQDLYTEVQCIMGNGYMGIPCGLTDAHDITIPQLHWWAAKIPL